MREREKEREREREREKERERERGVPSVRVHVPNLDIKLRPARNRFGAVVHVQGVCPDHEVVVLRVGCVGAEERSTGKSRREW